MKAALVSNNVTGDFKENRRTILALAESALDMGAELIVFPETAATGLADTGEAEHDLMIAENVSGPLCQEWGAFAKSSKVWFAAGLLERNGCRIYDSYVILDPEGNLALHYRRIDPHWHRPADDPQIYSVGEEAKTVMTPFGKLGVLVCGDVWDDGIVARMKALEPDYLLYPFLRARDQGKEWQAEFVEYCKRFSMVGVRTLAVNLYEGAGTEDSFGGAWFVDGRGRILSNLPEEGMGVLLVDTAA